MNQRLPVRIDREAFDRVLKRAAELQAHGRDIGEGLTEDEVLALGKEVGIPEAQLRQALLEEQTRVTAPEPSGLAARWAGPATVFAERVVQGSPESIGAALNQWFEQHEVLVVQRSTPQRITWEQASSFASAMKRIGWTFNANRAKPFLDRAELVSALITPLEPGFCHVTLVAQLGKTRSGYVWGGTTVGAVTVAGGAVLAAMGAPLLLAAALLVPAGMGSWAIGRAYRPILERARLGLERTLDELERRQALPAEAGAARPRALARDLGEAVREITREVRKAFEEKR